jgi:hypothetical protein
MGGHGTSKELALLAGRIDGKIPGFVRHLPAKLRFIPSHFLTMAQFVFRSCGQLCGMFPKRRDKVRRKGFNTSEDRLDQA